MKGFKALIAILIILTLVFSAGCQQLPFLVINPTPAPTPGTVTPAPSPISSDVPLKVSFVDVGQADCIIFQYGESAMIIDAGGNSGASSLVSTIKNMGISKFDVAVGTHPHEDHIGGLDAVIDSFEISKVYMPKISHTTKTFEDVLIAIQNKGLTVTTPVPGSAFTLGEDVQCTILAPNSASYDNLNNYSIVIKVVYGNTSFLITGDAEAESEEEMLAKGYDLDADVLKVGHHGSTSSTSPAFLSAVSPEYAVICVGEGNTYGHPHQETIDKLNAAGVQIYRTDLNGTIVLTSDGSSFDINPDVTHVLPTGAPSPTASPSTPSPSSDSGVQITKIFYDGLVPQVESDEYVEITNHGGAAVDLKGWILKDITDGNPSFTFPAYNLQPGESIRVYTNEIHAEYGGFSFGSGQGIWNNSNPNTAALFDARGQEVSRKSY